LRVQGKNFVNADVAAENGPFDGVASERKGKRKIRERAGEFLEVTVEGFEGERSGDRGLVHLKKKLMKSRSHKGENKHVD